VVQWLDVVENDLEIIGVGEWRNIISG